MSLSKVEGKRKMWKDVVKRQCMPEGDPRIIVKKVYIEEGVGMYAWSPIMKSIVNYGITHMMK